MTRQTSGDHLPIRLLAVEAAYGVPSDETVDASTDVKTDDKADLTFGLPSTTT